MQKKEYAQKLKAVQKLVTEDPHAISCRLRGKSGKKMGRKRRIMRKIKRKKYREKNGSGARILSSLTSTGFQSTINALKSSD